MFYNLMRFFLQRIVKRNFKTEDDIVFEIKLCRLRGYIISQGVKCRGTHDFIRPCPFLTKYELFFSADCIKYRISQLRR